MKKIYYFVWVVLAMPFGAVAQNGFIKGTVVDSATHQPVAHASITLQNGNKILHGVFTDDSGRYSIQDNALADRLVFSYVGMSQVTEQVNGRSVINAVLAGSNSSLNDVVVVGYGTQTKATLTGSVATVSAKELVTTKNENVVNMLAGKVPGLRMQQMSAEPGSYNTNYDIRGFGATPLIIIDGIPRGSGDLSRLNPNDIADISVLKDASAAVYGVEAANGVILVTTKSGSKSADGKVDINYSINQGWQQFIDVPKTVDAQQYMELFNESRRADFGNNFLNVQPPVYSDSLIALYNNGTLHTNNWMDILFRPTAPSTQQQLSVNGGTDKLNYFFDVGHLKQGGIYRTNSLNYDRWNVQSNINTKINKRLRAALLISAYVDTKKQPDGGRQEYEVFKNAENILPIAEYSPYANDNPDYLNNIPLNTPNFLAYTNSAIVGGDKFINKNFQGQLRLEYDVPGIEGLTAKASYNYGLTVTDNTWNNNAFNIYQYDPEDSVYTPSLQGAPSYVQRAYYTTTNTDMQLSLNYKRLFSGMHNVGATLVYEENYTSGDDFIAKRNLLLSIPYLFAGDQTDQQISMDPSLLNAVVRKSIVGRVDYDYKGRYLAEFVFRNDGSSAFSPNKHWGFFPGFLAGWRIDKEPFVQRLISPNVLTNLKLRASYGELGSDAQLNYQWVAGYNYPGTGSILGGNYVNGINSQGSTNDQFTWILAKSYNAGVDLELWHGLLGGSFDYFIRRRSGLAATPLAQIPGTVGESLPQENLNSDQTSGFELMLTHRNTIGKVNYNISGNVSISRTKNLTVEEQRAGNPWEQYYNQQSNRYTNIWWGYQYGGQFTSYAQIQNYNVNTGGGNQNVLPGDYYYVDLNHDGVIDQGDMIPMTTRDMPIVNFGLTLAASWKGFDVNVLLQGATDFHVKYAEQLANPLMYGGSALEQFMDRWHTADPTANPFDPNTVWIAGTYPMTGRPEAENSDNTKAVQNATYLRIKSLEVGYTLPGKFLHKYGVKNFRIYVNSYNLATFTGLKNSDPEHPGEVASGADWSTTMGGYLYPEDRIFNVGASITF